MVHSNHLIRQIFDGSLNCIAKDLIVNLFIDILNLQRAIPMKVNSFAYSQKRGDFKQIIDLIICKIILDKDAFIHLGKFLKLHYFLIHFLFLAKLFQLGLFESLMVKGLDVVYLSHLLPEVPNLIENNFEDWIAVLLLLLYDHRLRLLHTGQIYRQCQSYYMDCHITSHQNRLFQTKEITVGVKKRNEQFSSRNQQNQIEVYILNMRNLRRVLALSDTHGNLRQFQLIRQDNIQGDLFIHSGDFSKYSKQQGLQQFFHQLEQLKFRHKIVIAGNHEVALDPTLTKQQRHAFLQKFPCKMNRQNIIAKLKERCIYLQHGAVQIEGVKIFGTPFSNSFSGRGAFQYTSQNQEAIFKTIPEDTDILISHHPPFQILDKALFGHYVGSKVLLDQVKKIRPKLHVFGHVHQSHGVLTKDGTTFVNAATEYKQIDLNEII